jgi:RimJ/RimL family protein N-acetyltransferase
MRPQRVRMPGRYVDVEPLVATKHGDALWNATKGETNNELWAYMPYGPFPSCAEFDVHMAKLEASEDPLVFAIIDKSTHLAVGNATLMRIDEPNRVIEVGGIVFSPLLQRTRGATEAMYLMAKYVFDDLGYRRYEWKCNALNAPSRAAALRLGFQYEGLFRQHMIVKGQNRDTTWFSMLDSEWPARKEAFESWLDPANFDAAGNQIAPLRRD